MPKEKAPIDWDELLGKQTLDQAAKNAARETDAQLAAQISTLTSLKRKDIEKAFPKKDDKEKLVQLMQIVDSAKSRNDKINAIVENSEKFAGIIITLLGKFL